MTPVANCTRDAIHVGSNEGRSTQDNDPKAPESDLSHASTVDGATDGLACPPPEGQTMSGFYRASLAARRAKLKELAELPDDAVRVLSGEEGLADEQADLMVENTVGVMGLPLGVCVHLQVDGRDRVVPMAIEEPSVIAAASHGAKLLRAGGGVHTQAQPSHMIGQIQLMNVANPAAAEQKLLASKDELLQLANDRDQQLHRRGGGAVDLEVRFLPPADASDPLGPMLVVHLIVDVLDAMGANAVNTMCEHLSERVAELAGGQAMLRIVSNLADRRMAEAWGTVPFEALVGKEANDPVALARRIEAASVFAERDPYRAATHNKGIMNGIDAVLVAFGQDWRAVEAGAHAYAARGSRYSALARWRVVEGGLEGRLKLPLSVGVVGGITQVHPTVRVAKAIAGVDSAADLASLAAAVGLTQNLGALRALSAEGIQQGHMRVHARNVAVAAGATNGEVEKVARAIAAGGPRQVKLDSARQALHQMRAAASAAPTAAQFRHRFESLRTRYQEPILSLVKEVAAATTGSDSSLAQMCRYHFETGGKRLRALLPALVAECFDADPERLVPFGAACEMLHNATLVHDDLQDGDTTRRGHDTVWHRFGKAQAVNLGDAMFYFALQLIDRLDLPVARRQAAARRMLRETLRVIDGQERELALRRARRPTLDDYFRMVEGKTSGLFSLPMVGAAELCSAGSNASRALDEAARHMGVLFQVQDDVLDLYADKGRSERGSDVREGKRSILAVHALRHCEPRKAAWLREVLDRDRSETRDADVAAVRQLFRESGALDFALDELSRRRTLAIDQVRRAEHPALTAMVEGMCDVFLEPIAHLLPDEAPVSTQRSASYDAPHAVQKVPSTREAQEVVVEPSRTPDRNFCVRMLPAVSRTFALSIEALPAGLDDAVRVAYLLCRIADSFEDATGTTYAEREVLFSVLELALGNDDFDPRLVEQLSRDLLRGVPAEEAELVASAGAVLRSFRRLPAPQQDAIRRPVLTMLTGMRQYSARAHAAGGLRLRDEADLERYCYFVAGTVGELLTELFAQATDVPPSVRLELDERAVSFGLGLQMVNILKDVAEDCVRGVCYLPESLADEQGVELGSLLREAHRPAALAMIRKLAARARQHLRRAREYTLLWPLPRAKDVRQFCAVPLMLAELTLDEVEQGDDTLRPGRTPKVDRAVVSAVLTAVLSSVGDHTALARLLGADPKQPPATVAGGDESPRAVRTAQPSWLAD